MDIITHIDLAGELDKALEQSKENSKYTTIPLTTLVKLADDVALIKELLFKGDGKFMEIAIKLDSVHNNLKSLSNGK